MKKQLFSLTLNQLPEKELFLAPLIATYAQHLQLNGNPQATSLGNSVVEIYQFLVQNAVWYHETPSVTVSLMLDETRLLIRFEDKAEPWPQDWIDVDIRSRVFEETPAFIDQLVATNLGKQGRTLEAVVSVLVSSQDERSTNAKPPRTEAAIKPEFTFRLLDSAEAHKAVDLMYFAYGYDYGLVDVYSTSETRQLMEQQMIQTIVAEVDNDVIAASLTMRKRHAESRLTDLCQGMAKPTFARNRLFERLILKGMELAKEQFGLQGVTGTVPNKHYVSLKTVLAADYVPTGVLLGCVPASVMPKQIGTHLGGDRDAFLMIYRPLAPMPFETIYVPHQHQAIMQVICQQIDFTPEILAPPVKGHSTALPDCSKIRVLEHEYLNWAMIQVDVCGADVIERLFEQLDALHMRQFRAVQLYVDLSDPIAPQFCDQFEAMGFFFAGLLPDEKPWLVLQRLHNVAVDFDALDYPNQAAIDIQTHVEQAYDQMQMRRRQQVADLAT